MKSIGKVSEEGEDGKERHDDRNNQEGQGDNAQHGDQGSQKRYGGCGSHGGLEGHDCKYGAGEENKFCQVSHEEVVGALASYRVMNWRVIGSLEFWFLTGCKVQLSMNQKRLGELDNPPKETFGGGWFYNSCRDVYSNQTCLIYVDSSSNLVYYDIKDIENCFLDNSLGRLTLNQGISPV